MMSFRLGGGPNAPDKDKKDSIRSDSKAASMADVSLEAQGHSQFCHRISGDEICMIVCFNLQFQIEIGFND